MKGKRFLLIGSALFMGLASAAGEATTRKTGLNACADALAADLGRNAVHPPVYRLDERSDLSARRLHPRETVYLDASDPDNGNVVARYDCVINARAEVLDLIRLPLDAADAGTRSFEAE